MLHPCWVDELIDVKKYPMAFRQAPTNTQVGKGANHYVFNVLKLKKVAVVSDTTGYGTASANTYVPMLKAMGAEVVYINHVDAANPDLSSPSCCACRAPAPRPSCRGASTRDSCREFSTRAAP